MINNRFITISTCYNVAPFVEMTVLMNKYQSYNNRLHIYVDDQSSDNTYDILMDMTKDDNKSIVLQNPNNGSCTKAFIHAMEYLESNNLIGDEDIIVEIDGDDWLSSHFVLQYVNEIYQNPEIWLTYGQYQGWPAGNLGGHSRMDLRQYPLENLRQVPFAYTHLRTFKYWLFNKINRKDFINPTTNDYFNAAWDLVSGFPLVEMAGYEHIYRIEDILLILNRADALDNESKTRLDLQKQTENILRNMPSYNRIIK